VELGQFMPFGSVLLTRKWACSFCACGLLYS